MHVANFSFWDWLSMNIILEVRKHESLKLKNWTPIKAALLQYLFYFHIKQFLNFHENINCCRESSGITLQVESKIQ